MLEVLIIEDEAKAARELSSIIAKLRPQWRITGVTESIEQTLTWLAENKAPSLIFSDIQLGDGLSFEIFAQHTLTCPIVFCTAFDEHAIRAFENNGIDYVLKPLSEARLERSIQKLENLSHALKQNILTESVIYSSLLTAFRNWPKSSLLVHFRGKIFPLRTSDIGFIYYDGNSTIAHSKDGQQYVLQQRLDALELELDKLLFFRANRQFIIHRGSVVEVENYFSRKLVVKLGAKTPEPVVISKAKASLFLAWLQH